MSDLGTMNSVTPTRQGTTTTTQAQCKALYPSSDRERWETISIRCCLHVFRSAEKRESSFDEWMND